MWRFEASPRRATPKGQNLHLPHSITSRDSAYIKSPSVFLAHLDLIFNSKAGFGEIGMGLLRAIRPWDQWIAGWGFDMAQGEPDLSDGSCSERIRALVGDPDLQAEIGAVLWYVNQRTPPTTRSDGCSAVVTPCTVTRRRAGWVRTPASRTRSTWPGRSPSSSRATPGRAAGLLLPRAGAGREADRRPGQPVPHGLRPAAGVVRPRQRGPGRRRAGEDQGASPGGRQGESGSTRR